MRNRRLFLVVIMTLFTVFYGLNAQKRVTPLYIDQTTGEEVSPVTFRNTPRESIADVATMDKIKAVELYGERAANGVVLVTLKEGVSWPVNEVTGDVDRLGSGKSARGDESHEEADTPFIQVEQMPTFKGGNVSSFRNWVQSQLKYPPQAAKEGIAGRVVVSFVVDKDGTIGNFEVLRSPHVELSDEVLRVLSRSPKWKPGTQRGKLVRVKFTLPIDFSLNKSNVTTRTQMPAGQTQRSGANRGHFPPGW